MIEIYDDSCFRTYAVKNTHLEMWCGYLEIKNAVYLKYYDEIDKIFHGGITYDKNNTWGFDCAHWNDKHKFNPNGVTRDLDYVKTVLEKAVTFLKNQ